VEKHIITWSYWLGMVSAVLAVLARLLNAAGSSSLNFLTKGNPVGYRSLLDGAVLLFLIANASASYSSQKSRS
jgi:hypothetical protein